MKVLTLSMTEYFYIWSLFFNQIIFNMQHFIYHPEMELPCNATPLIGAFVNQEIIQKLHERECNTEIVYTHKDHVYAFCKTPTDPKNCYYRVDQNI